MRHYREIERRSGEDKQMEANRVTGSLAGLAFMLLLVVGGLLLMRQMQVNAQVEDCLMSGRVNCDAVLERASQ